MLKEYFKEYQRYFYASLGAHVLILGLLCFSSDPSQPSRSLPSEAVHPSNEIVQAVVVDADKVAKEVDRLKAVEKAEAHALEIKEKAAAKKMQEIKAASEKEAAKLAQIKQDIAKAKLEAEHQERLAEIKTIEEKKKEQEKESKKEKEQKDLAALEDERVVEENRIKKLNLEREKAEHEKAEKKRLEAKQKLAEKQKAAEEKRLAGIKAARDKERAAAAREAKSMSLARSVLDEWSKKVEMNKRRVLGIPDGITCTLLIRVLPDGSIRVQIVKSSGNAIHDDLSVKAAYKSEPFPLPDDPDAREKLKEVEIKITSKEGMNDV